jgi:hypothetical protein
MPFRGNFAGRIDATDANNYPNAIGQISKRRIEFHYSTAIAATIGRPIVACM